MNAHKLAQEVSSRYLNSLDEFASHADNVICHLRSPVQAVTVFLLRQDEDKADDIPAPSAEEEEKKMPGNDWRDYLGGEDLPDLGKVNEEAYDALNRRTKARLDAFLTGVSLAVTGDRSSESPAKSDAKPSVLAAAAALAKGTSPRSDAENKDKKPPASKKKSDKAVSLDQGLAGLGEKRGSSNSVTSPVLSSLNSGSKNLIRSISSQSSRPVQRQQQIGAEQLTTRLELYIRSLCRVKAQGRECVVAAEPARALKARARAVVVAFVDTVDTVHQQSTVLTRLLKSLAKELLAVEFLSETLCRLIRQLVADYVQSVSFASLAFLSTPENSAEQRLTPLVLKFLRYLQSNWRDCVAECELERMLSLSIDNELRHTFKHIEFRSIGHLLEVCQGFRHQLHHIELAPGMRAVEETIDENEAVRQAIRDLKREVITINGNVLPPVRSRKELIGLLSQSLNSRTLTSAPVKVKRKNRKATVRRIESEPALSSASSFDEYDSTSGVDTDFSGAEGAASKPRRRQKAFRLSTVDFLTKRLLLAASRTGTGGDAYFVVRDLFGGEDVEVVPSKNICTHGRTVRPGSIEIIVRLASVSIKCHGSFDVYPKSLVGDCEPLIQVHTTTTETIALQEVRATDSSVSNKEDECDSDDDEATAMVVQERKTERTGWRTLSIRPALYEKYEEFSTPS